MSEIEINKGRLIPIVDIEDYVEEGVTESFLNQFTWNLPNETLSSMTFEDKLDILESYEIIAKIGEAWYEIKWNIRRDNNLYFANVTEDIKGVIDFHTMHHNGGCHWTEVIEEKLK